MALISGIDTKRVHLGLSKVAFTEGCPHDGGGGFTVLLCISVQSFRYYYFSEDTSDPEGPNTYQVCRVGRN